MRLDDVPREWLAVLAAVALGWALFVTVRGWLRGVRRRRRFVRGGEGEREAALLLEAHGFAIEGAQVATSYELLLDGEPVTVSVRADYVVSRGGRRFVAEVKTGRMATRIDTPATRRQLLEYEHAFAADGVLLVDADARTIRAVAFEAPRPSAASSVVALAFVATIAAVIVATLR